MATDQLALYNIALASVGERPIDTLKEGRSEKHLLDKVWDRGGGATKYFLAQGLWNHGMREQSLDASTAIGGTTSTSPDFNFTYAFDKPIDMVRLSGISAHETFSVPLVRYEMQSTSIFTDVTPLYVRYVSDSTNHGGDLSNWPETFTLWAGTYLGSQIAPNLKESRDVQLVERRTRRLLVDARSKDAQEEPTRFPPTGSWANARLGRSNRRRDRGSRSSLTG